MGRREIIIADGDARYRNQVTDIFRKTGYRVATADSVEQVLASVQGNLTQVLLLGSAFSTKISAPDLIHLLKKCSRGLRIIMVSDEMPLAQARKVRQEGIFYHALKPATAADTEELEQAVACAFLPQRGGLTGDPAQLLQDRAALGKDAPKTTSAGTHSLKSHAGVVAMVSLVLAAGCYFRACGPGAVRQVPSLSLVLFFAFSALVVVYQLLPIFRIKLPGRVAEPHAAPRVPCGAGTSIPSPGNTFHSR
jgi:CheY-like chemotaxis protein